MAEPAGIVIAGDGPVAAVLALALGEHGVGFTICGSGAAAPDRPIALSHGSRLLLERLDVFGGLAATPIESIHVSQRGAFGRTVIRASDERLPALGYVVSYAGLCEALRQRLGSRLRTATVSHYSPAAQGGAVGVQLQDPGGGASHAVARLLVLAEGGERPGPGTARRREYGQSAIVAQVRAELPHRNRAWERFTPTGPLALLPSGGQLALVWSTTHESARALHALDDAPFLARLGEAFGTRLGRFIEAGPRSSFPVSLRHERGLAAPRVLAIGNAAQALHPVAGQGLNLGLRDAWELARLLADGEAAADPGARRLLQRYLDARALDRQAGIRFTDALVRVFSSAHPALALARGAGLAALNVAAPARRFLARRMMFGTRGL